MVQTLIRITSLDEGFSTRVDGRAKAHSDWQSVVDYVQAKFYTHHYAGVLQSPNDTVMITITSELNPPKPANQ